MGVVDVSFLLFLRYKQGIILSLDSEGPAAGGLALFLLGLWPGTTKDCSIVSGLQRQMMLSVLP